MGEEVLALYGFSAFIAFQLFNPTGKDFSVLKGTPFGLKRLVRTESQWKLRVKRRKG